MDDSFHEDPQPFVLGHDAVRPRIDTSDGGPGWLIRAGGVVTPRPAAFDAHGVAGPCDRAVSECEDPVPAQHWALVRRYGKQPDLVVYVDGSASASGRTCWSPRPGERAEAGPSS